MHVRVLLGVLNLRIIEVVKFAVTFLRCSIGWSALPIYGSLPPAVWGIT